MAKSPLNLDLNNLVCRSHEEPPEELVIVAEPSQSEENLELLSDYELEEKIQRLKSTNISNMSSRLPDKGMKLRALTNRLIELQEKRKSARIPEDTHDLGKSTRSSFTSDSSPEFKLKSATPKSCSRVSSALQFSQRQDKSHNCPNAFDEDLRSFGRGNKWSSIQKDKSETNISSRQFPFQSPSSLSSQKDKSKLPNGNQNGISCRSSPFGNMSLCSSEKRRDSHNQTSLSSKIRKVQTVVLLDEEDSHPVKTIQVDKPAEENMDARIYYPSRDDPEAVELCHSDVECLNPGSPLSSPVMNYYIQYLQRSPSVTRKDAYHFFNTYFYKKLEAAVSCKRSDKDTLYEKIRRWWKGINIFQKAYIFLPIHADQHWSLVIICIPIMGDESGPIILHLDSLGFHPSGELFDNIESFLKEEWSYLNQVGPPSDVPISDRIWKNLSRRIVRKVIMVPQQKNDYDCGLFVLYFMERFIMEAPQRLRKKDLDMFGSRWFLPEEASDLRKRIRNLLHEQFERCKLEDAGQSSSDS